MKRFLGVNVWLAGLIVAGVQSAALGYMVTDRAQLLQSGKEVVLDVRPVDPRSLFRGDYVILNYGVLSRIDGKFFRDIPDGTRTVYVTMRRGELSREQVGQNQGPQVRPEPDEANDTVPSEPVIGWMPVAVTASYPKTVDDEHSVMRADVKERYRHRLSTAKAVMVAYGLEAYFVPEGEGKKLEKLIGKGELRVIAAIGEDGRTAIKGIEARGKRVYEEEVW